MGTYLLNAMRQFDIYRNHFLSVTKINLDLSLEEAETIKEIANISFLLEKLPESLKNDGFFLETRRKLVSLRRKFNIHAQYDVGRDVLIGKEISKKLKKTKTIKQSNFLDFGGIKREIHKFKFTIQIKLTIGEKIFKRRIVGDVYLNNLDEIPRKAVILVPGLSSYRQIYHNIAGAVANDGYMVCLFDLPSQGDSIGAYGYGELGENIQRIALHLRNEYKIERIGLLGHSVGATGCLFAMMHYDMEMNFKLQKIKTEIKAFTEKFSKKEKLNAETIKEIKNKKAEMFETLKLDVIRTYNKWPELINTVCVLNPMFKVIHHGIPWVSRDSLHKIFSYRLGQWTFKKSIGAAKSMTPFTTAREKAFVRLLLMKKKSDPKRYKELRKIKPIFQAGFTILDKEAFFKESVYATVPMDYLNLIREFYPQALQRIYSIPKLFLISEDDDITLLKQNLSLYKEFPQEFGNCDMVHVSGLNHLMKYPGEVFNTEDPTNNTFLNYIHSYFKYHL